VPPRFSQNKSRKRTITGAAKMKFNGVLNKMFAGIEIQKVKQKGH